MSLAQDIELDAFDLRIKDGDFAIHNGDITHVEHILLAHKGNYKQTPIIGIGIRDYVNSPATVFNVASFKRKVTAQMEFDGYQDVKIDTAGGLAQIKVDAIRK